MADTIAPVYCFGPFVLDVGDRSLKRDGHAIPLTPKLSICWSCLVASGGRLIEKAPFSRRSGPMSLSRKAA